MVETNMNARMYAAIKTAMINAGDMTVQELADKIGCSRYWTGQIVRGKEWSLPILTKIAKELELDLAKLTKDGKARG
jgi:hypothetical protein